MREVVLELEQITKTYYGIGSPVHALQGVSFRLYKGEMVAIMGPSGSGKSTLMNILGCLDKPDSGTYTIGDQDVMGMDNEELAHLRNKRIGFVFQHFNLLGRATALENVALPLLYLGIKGEDLNNRAGEVLRLVGLEGREHHFPNQLSGGQQQRVAIARALVNQPDLFLADEPTGALDTKTSAGIMALLKRLLKEQSLSMVIVTHEMDIALYCHRIVRLRDGMIESEEKVENPHQAQEEADSES